MGKRKKDEFEGEIWRREDYVGATTTLAMTLLCTHRQAAKRAQSERG